MILGVDVSRWNLVRWPSLYARGVRFAGIRATMGARGVDPLYREHRAACEGLGILPIAYHLLYPEQDIAAQVHHFLTTSGGETFAVDVEPIDGEPSSTYRAWREAVYAFACEVSAIAAMPPLVYGSPAFLRALELPADMWGAPLWIADWRARETPEVPPPWRRVVIRQTGTRPEPNGALLDWDRFEGSIEDLRSELVFGG